MSKNLTREDRSVFDSYEVKYYNCLGEESARVFIPTSNINLAVNVSTGKCKYIIYEMQDKMSDLGIPRRGLKVILVPLKKEHENI